MISYAGTDLSFPDPGTLERAARLLDPAEVWPWVLRQMPPLRRGRADWPESIRTVPFRLNSLVWPSGASRWAYLHALVTTARLRQILDAVATAQAGSRDLTLDDGKRSLTTTMYLLPPRPLFQVPGAGQLHLLTLADDRWRWWWQEGTVTIDQGHTTWAELYEAIGLALGITIEADTVAEEYGHPPVELVGRYECLPVLLDAVAYSAGQRLVRQPGGIPDGRVFAFNAPTSRLREDDNLLLVPRKAGGAVYAAEV